MFRTDPLSLELSAYTDDSYEPPVYDENAGPFPALPSSTDAALTPAF